MLSSARGFWARHRRKILVSLGVAGAGYAAYRLYDGHRRQLVLVEQRALEERAADELIKNQLQTHFENVQRISDTTTLPFAMHYLRSRIMEELDISHLTEKLLQGKGESSALTPKEKYDTWEKIKIFSFTRTMSSIWAMTLLGLYVKSSGHHIRQTSLLRFCSWYRCCTVTLGCCQWWSNVAKRIATLEFDRTGISMGVIIMSKSGSNATCEGSC